MTRLPTLGVAALVAALMVSGCASFGANKVVSSHMSYNDAVQLTSEDMVFAFELVFSFVEEDDGASVRLARYRLVMALTLPDPDDPGAIAAPQVVIPVGGGGS